MNRIIDCLLLLVYCLGSLLFFPVNDRFLIVFLIAVLYASLNYYLKSWKYGKCIHLAFLILCIVIPECNLFLPLAIYGTRKIKAPVFTGIFLLTGCIHLISESSVFLFFLLTGCILAFWMEYQSTSKETLTQLYKQTRDNSMERNLLLKEKNQALLEKQDYEIYTATLKERNRIAREIHDNVGHILSRAILMNGALKMLNKDASLNFPLTQMEDTLTTAMNNVRESVHDLHDDSIHLQNVLKNLVDSFTFCKITLDYDMNYDVPRSIKYSFITIVKEALNNIMKHSNASYVCITAREHPGLYQLIIEDNGTGLSKNPDGIDSNLQSKGLGLLNMKERVHALNGRIQVTKDQGFHIYITIPKKEDNKQ